MPVDQVVGCRWNKRSDAVEYALEGQVPAEEIEMRRAPGSDLLVVVAVGDAAADHQEQNLGQRMQDAPHVARVLDFGE